MMFLLAACGSGEVVVDPPLPAVVHTRQVVPLSVSIDDVMAGEVGLHPRTPDVVSVDSGGALCLADGQAEIVVTEDGVEVDNLVFRCHLVETVEVAEVLARTAAAKATPVTFRCLDAAGEPVEGAERSLEVADSSVASVAGESVGGLSEGETTLTVHCADRAAEVPLRVLAVASIGTPPDLSVELGDALVVAIEPAAADGTPLPDAPLQAKVGEGLSGLGADWSELRDNPLTLQAEAFGRPALSLRSGDVEAEVPVEVYERRDAEAVDIEDKQTRSFTFNEPGIYEVEVAVTSSDGSSWGVEARWAGANCGGHGEAQAFTTSCTVTESATLVLTNPALLGVGPSANGQITVVRRPLP